MLQPTCSPTQYDNYCIFKFMMSSTKRMIFKKVTHVIFDLDGLLLDTETLYTQGTNNILKKYGKSLDWETKSQLMGLPGEDAAKHIIKVLNLPITWETYYRLAQEQYGLLMPNCQLMPGAEKLIRHLHTKFIPIAIATSSSQESYDRKVSDKKELFSLFNHVVAGGSDPEVKHGKPAPDIFLICASRFSDAPKPSQCLIFEDSPIGVTAALKAEMQCIMVPDEHLSSDQTTEATQVLKSLEDVKLEQFGLPEFEH